MVDTGWKAPLSVAQDNRPIINNNYTCYNFLDLKDILKNDYSHAYIPTTGGIDKVHASPVVYAYNYKFNIPANATIKKVYILPIIQQSNGGKWGKITRFKFLKLKVGASTTDNGVGIDIVLKYPFLKNLEIPVQSWTSEDTFKIGSSYIPAGDSKYWNVELTPAVVNSTNFGFVMQLIGTKENKWVNPYIAKMLMKVEYTVPSVKKTEVNILEGRENYTYTTIYHGNTLLKFTENSNKGGTGFSDMIIKLDVNKPESYKTITIKYQHKGNETESPTLVIESRGLLIGDDKKSKITLPTIHFPKTETEKTYEQSFKVYPNNLNGEQLLVISPAAPINNAISAITGTTLAKSYINMVVRFNVEGELISSYGNETTAEFVRTGQFCKINNNIFKNNKAYNKKGEKTYGDGGAMYILSELFDHETNGEDNNTYENNTANGKVNDIYWNGTNYPSQN